MAAFPGGWAGVCCTETTKARARDWLAPGTRREPAADAAWPSHRLASGKLAGEVVSEESRSMPALSPETTHKTDTAAVASVAGAPEPCAASRSSAGYAARGEPGDPRGRKFAVGLLATNSR